MSTHLTLRFSGAGDDCAGDRDNVDSPALAVFGVGPAVGAAKRTAAAPCAATLQSWPWHRWPCVGQELDVVEPFLCRLRSHPEVGQYLADDWPLHRMATLDEFLQLVHDHVGQFAGFHPERMRPISAGPARGR